MIISLIGYMGSGKTLIANKLYEVFGVKKIDLDTEIFKRTGISVSEIFEKKGEIFFRKLEKEVLEECLFTKDDCVLSLGGGTPCYYNNMEIINNKSISIYLRAKVNTLVSRLLPEKDTRPLIAKLSNEDLPIFVGQHLFERTYFYNQAKMIVDTDNLTPNEVVGKILEQLYKEKG